MKISPHAIEFYHESDHAFIKALLDLKLLNFDLKSQHDLNFNNGILNQYDDSNKIFLYSVYQVQGDNIIHLFDHNDGRFCRFFLIQAFLNQYRKHSENLPIVDTQKRFSNPDDRRIPIYQDLLKIMLMPLNSYRDFIKAMQAYESISGKSVLNAEIYQKRIFSGSIESWQEPSSDQFLFIEKLSDDEYHLCYSERGSERTLMRFYNERIACEYVLNHYCQIL